MEANTGLPGFNPDITFKQHSTRIKRVLYTGSKGRSFISLDRAGLKVWTRDYKDESIIEVLHDVAFPSAQPDFISALCHVPSSNVLLAACLDNTLKVYNDHLRLRSSMPWPNGTVMDMLVNSTTDELITTGSAGVKLWVSASDCDGYAAEQLVAAAERPLLGQDGQPVPWCFGRFQLARQRLAFNIPGLKTGMTAADAASADDRSHWCQRIQLVEEEQLLVCLFKADIHVFSTVTGDRMYSWSALAPRGLASMAYVHQCHMLLTACRESSAMAWRVQQDGSLSKISPFAKSAGPISCLSVAADGNSCLTLSLDGYVALWDLETLKPQYKMKFATPPSHVEFYRLDGFLCTVNNDIRLFYIKHKYEPWMEFNSPVTSLQPLSHGLLLVTLQDSSARILDASSTQRDKSVITTVPQLSTASLRAVVCSLTAGRLFVLLTDGQVHVWELHLKRPPTFQEAWTHLTKDNCRSLAFMDGGALEPSIASHLGLSRGPDGTPEDHLLLGTAAGEVVACDCTRQGLVVLRFPVFNMLRPQPVQRVLLDLDCQRLATLGGRSCKVWDLATLRVMQEFDSKSELVQADILGGRMLLGTAGGQLYQVDLQLGCVVRSSHVGDHEAEVRDVAGSALLQHWVTCSHDGYLKVFDCRKVLRATICIRRPLQAACFLNEKGDIVTATGTSILRVAADTFAVTKLGAGGKAVETIFDEARGRGQLPRVLQRSMTSALQRLSSTVLPLPRHLLVGTGTRRTTDDSTISDASFTELKGKGPTAPIDLDHSRAKAQAAAQATQRQLQRDNTLITAVKRASNADKARDLEDVQEAAGGSGPALDRCDCAQNDTKAGHVGDNTTAASSSMPEKAAPPQDTSPEAGTTAFGEAAVLHNLELDCQVVPLSEGSGRDGSASEDECGLGSDSPGSTAALPARTSGQEGALRGVAPMDEATAAAGVEPILTPAEGSSASKQPSGASAQPRSGQWHANTWRTKPVRNQAGQLVASAVQTVVVVDLNAYQKQRWAESVRKKTGGQVKTDGGSESTNGSTSGSSDSSSSESNVDSDSVSSSDCGSAGHSGGDSDAERDSVNDGPNHGRKQLSKAAGGAPDVYQVGLLSVEISHGKQARTDSAAAPAAAAEGTSRPAALAGVPKLLRRAVPVVSDPNAFAEGMPRPDALKLIRLRRAEELERQAASLAGLPAGMVKRKKKKKKPAAAADTDTGAAGKIVSYAAELRRVGAAAAAADAGTKPKRKKGKKKRSKAAGHEWLSVHERLASTTKDAAVVTELMEAEAHDTRQQAIVRQLATQKH